MIYEVRVWNRCVWLRAGYMKTANEKKKKKKGGQLLDLVCIDFLLNRNCFTRFCINGFEPVYYNM
jgi:hypothetical protein